MERDKPRVYFGNPDVSIEMTKNEAKILREPAIYYASKTGQVVGGAAVFGQLFYDGYKLATHFESMKHVEIVRDPKIFGRKYPFSTLQHGEHIKRMKEYTAEHPELVWIIKGFEGRYNIFVHRDEDGLVDSVVLDQNCIFSVQREKINVILSTVSTGVKAEKTGGGRKTGKDMKMLKHGDYNSKDGEVIYIGRYYLGLPGNATVEEKKAAEKLKLSSDEINNLENEIKESLSATDAMNYHRQIRVDLNDNRTVLITLSYPKKAITEEIAQEILDEIHAQLVDGAGENGYVLGTDENGEEKVIYVD